MKVELVANILDANTAIAGQNRERFAQSGTFVVNLMSSPGAGKTTILEETLGKLKDRIAVGVIEGDICTTRDADRIAKRGVPVVQINTSGTCHLDANMIASAVTKLGDQKFDLIVVENVGNLVCPAEFDLGEDIKVMVISVTEGNDKPMKYPLMFRESAAILVNKIDLLPYTDFDPEELKRDVSLINPHAKLFFVSAKTGENMNEWTNWLLEQIMAKMNN
ncbi:MAG: hydrogenase nickel incorporation protein HypB [Firmicutes bacterium]|nr:hydrogenase nickel incorporation protein HypB [Bacillota bacterium]